MQSTTESQKKKKKLCPRIAKSLVLDYESIIIHGQYTNNPFIIY